MGKKLDPDEAARRYLLLEIESDLWELLKCRFTFKSTKARLAISRLSEPLIHQKTILEDTEGLLNDQPERSPR